MKLNGYQIISESIHPAITFPDSEITEILRNIKETGYVNTLRTDQEFGKYKLNETLIAPQLKMVLKVVSIKRLSSYKEYEFINFLNKEQIEYLKKQKKIEHIKLKKV